jgi:hypothetical protein
MYSLFAINSGDSHFVTNLSQSSSFKSLNFLKGFCFFSHTRHKSVFVAPPRMRDALHSCPLPLLF